MMLQNVDQIPPYERMHFWVLCQDVENSPYLNNTQKIVIERKLQEIIDIWTTKDYV